MSMYKVLWVDDDESIVSGYQQKAEEYNLNLIPFTNWEEAEISLRTEFDDYSAIILDANCKINKDSCMKESFISVVTSSLSNIFGEKRKTIPWYILSAGTMKHFGIIVEGAQEQHSVLEEEWGNMLYLKDAPEDDVRCSSNLFKNIQRIAPSKSLNVVLYRHKDVFSYIGANKLFCEDEVRKDLLRMLGALYFPEENINYEYHGNPLRKILQHIFMVACDNGLLPDILKQQKKETESINLTNSSKFLAGIPIKYDDNNSIRWGEDKKKKESILPSHLSLIVQSILELSNEDSHIYVINQDKKELFFSYVLQLCYVILWFGKYIEDHPNKEENIKMHKIVIYNGNKSHSKPVQKIISKNVVNNVIGKQFLVEKVNGSNVVSGKYKLDSKFKNVPTTIVIKNIISNEGEDKSDYQYIITEFE